ncbi:Hypothetical protein D9617_33g038040 [Elsinoe fawcettii]|nr:Hypothetical protein D9617_33g038040 [Elsinoe fawcettii]
MMRFTAGSQKNTAQCDQSMNEEKVPTVNQKKFRKSRPSVHASLKRVPIAVFNKSCHRKIPPRRTPSDEFRTDWHLLPPEVQDMVIAECFALDKQNYQIPSTPFPTILQTSSFFHERGLLAFFKNVRFSALLFRHGSSDTAFTLPWHRVKAPKWTDLPADTYHIRNLVLRIVPSFCIGCAPRNVATDNPPCWALRQIVIHLRSRDGAAEEEEYWNRPVSGKTPPLYGSHFRHERAIVCLGHRGLVKRDLLRPAIMRVVEGLFGKRGDIEVQNMLHVRIPASCFSPHMFI